MNEKTKSRNKGKERNSACLGKLLKACGDVSSPQWQQAWSEFYSQYDGFIRQKISEQCKAWRVSRLGLQFSETVLDITGKVYLDLCKDNCHAIRGFRGGDSETIFLAWLKRICYNSTKAYLSRYFKERIVETELAALSSIKNYVTHLDFSERWELFEAVVEVIKSNRDGKRKNKERDTNIFLLYVWADFNSEMMSFHPFLRNLGHRVVDNVVNRTRLQLRNNRAQVN